MEQYSLYGSYRVGDKIAKFSCDVSVDNCDVSGKGIEGKISGCGLIFKTDDIEFNFTKRLEVDGSSMYSGKVYLCGILFSDALASMERKQ